MSIQSRKTPKKKVDKKQKGSAKRNANQEMKNSETEQKSQNEEVEPYVKFTKDGKITWGGFHDLYGVIGFMQLHIFRNWDHPVFVEGFLKNVTKPAQPVEKTPSQENQELLDKMQKAREEEEEEIWEDTSEFHIDDSL